MKASQTLLPVKMILLGALMAFTLACGAVPTPCRQPLEPCPPALNSLRPA